MTQINVRVRGGEALFSENFMFTRENAKICNFIEIYAKQWSNKCICTYQPNMQKYDLTSRHDQVLVLSDRENLPEK